MIGGQIDDIYIYCRKIHSTYKKSEREYEIIVERFIDDRWEMLMDDCYIDDS